MEVVSEESRRCLAAGSWRRAGIREGSGQGGLKLDGFGLGLKSRNVCAFVSRFLVPAAAPHLPREQCAQSGNKIALMQQICPFHGAVFFRHSGIVVPHREHCTKAARPRARVHGEAKITVAP